MGNRDDFKAGDWVKLTKGCGYPGTNSIVPGSILQVEEIKNNNPQVRYPNGEMGCCCYDTWEKVECPNIKSWKDKLKANK